MKTRQGRCVIIGPELEERFVTMFGDRWWNDVERIYCVPVRHMTSDEMLALDIAKDDGDYLILDMSWN